ncbi:hypothetical protein LN040_04010 [Desulfovibrio subterraneus]|uniref:hypothetical protein n=1 Tax=Desulfovibrio subterraneus TaxID=2718620 RepID=UPI0022B8BE12|nr:hypothetical protein [Desulfovibrio subterraneus]WBF68279.1 hypothetical protein LN040_04010 [Desulfovibrio subterraneus]
MKVVKFGKRELRLGVVQGKIYDLEKTTRTSVSGGGGATVNGTGTTNPIRTTHSNHVEFWVKTEDGKEVYFNEPSVVPLRNGHDVKVYYHVVDNYISSLRIVNLTTGRGSIAKLPDFGGDVIRFGLLAFIGSPLVGSFLSSFVSRGSKDGVFGIGLVATFCLVFYYASKRYNLVKNVRQEIVDFIEGH